MVWKNHKTNKTEEKFKSSSTSIEWLTWLTFVFKSHVPTYLKLCRATQLHSIAHAFFPNERDKNFRRQFRFEKSSSSYTNHVSMLWDWTEAVWWYMGSELPKTIERHFLKSLFTSILKCMTKECKPFPLRSYSDSNEWDYRESLLK